MMISPGIVGLSGFIQRRGAAGELRACLRQPVAMFLAPAAPISDPADRIYELEDFQTPQHLGRVEQVAGEHRDDTLLQLPGIARLAEHLLHHRAVESVDEEREACHPRALALFQLE